MLFNTCLGLAALLHIASVTAYAVGPAPVNQTTCNGQTYVYEELAGWGILAGDARDKLGDTIGGIGSAIAIDKKSWKKKKGDKEAYEGILYGLPDRGWNTQGTQNTQSRIHQFSVSFDIVEATVEKPASPNFQLKYLDTILLSGPDGTRVTGLDADPTGHISFKGFPDLPVVTYTGDGFGGEGPGGKGISVDAEGLVLGDDDTFWISDEYGPYIYQFDKRGKMVSAIRPPDAFIPIRNGTESFNAASPPIYDPDFEILPEDPETGRANNQGLEALTASPDGKYLYAMLQSATIQDGGKKSATRRNTRLLKYRVKKNKAEYEAEYVVQLPLTPNGKVAGQSEIHFISSTQFLVLARDSGAGHGQDASESTYRNADIIDISRATDVKGAVADASSGAVASAKGELKAGITPATYCPWLSYNTNAQLNRFGAHNGGPQDAGLLNEKWESFALVPVDGKFAGKGKGKGKGEGEGKEYYLISVSDNDFITQNGFINNGKVPYADASGFNLDTQVLVFKVRLPKGADPL
ncbi:esterase-like activity of phytase-domain-containing protein [Massariosphaeria phaeospora]|uniref:Esterase-like activity of phytase-domain-containing protein n=1 Tax=Massariosphaeria phaeospora TaxID=100035 RepID=A0A7C8M518_9PLEO|nr:esterase-like activity of phytase-domain-containing protein [Massariosphaeria phaeospora]